MRTKPATFNPRSQSRTERFRREVLAIHGPVCKMPHCLLPDRAIDLTLKHPHPGSYTADHIITVQELQRTGAPAHAYFDPTNGRPAHHLCNSTAGAPLSRTAHRYTKMGRLSTGPHPPNPTTTSTPRSRTW